ncbi:MAG TPA: YceI family protein [Acidimicrobiales bacterium]|nr:YceI family protein [Acidimicrobiales bacterium]
MTSTETRTLPVTGTWSIDPSHSEVGFSVRHLGISKTKGRFGAFSGDIVIAERPEDSRVSVEIDAASVDTRDAGRDEHLRSADFFDVETHPTLTFTATDVAAKGDHWAVTGDLTIAGVTKSVVLDTEVTGLVTDPWGNDRVAFHATAEVNREDFGLTWNAALETGGFLVGKTVKLDLEVEAVLQK